MLRPRLPFAIAVALRSALDAAPAAQDLTLPNKPDSVKFAVIGDSGTGGSAQYRVAEQLDGVATQFPFEFVLMLGDNLYGGERPKRLREEVRGPVQAAARRGRQVLRLARQPRQSRTSGSTSRST